MYLKKFNLEGRRALVTGGAGGIGAAVVDALLESGAHVTIVDNNNELLTTVKKQRSKENVAFVKIDIADPTAVEALATEREGFDILINNAGIGRQAAAEEITDEEWREVMAINADAVFWCSRAFGRKMIERGKGVIVNMGSMAGEIVVRPQKNVHYNASKAAVHHITKSMAAEWADKGVRVNAIAPGFISTSMNAFAMEEYPETYNFWLSNIPMGRMGQIDEIASVALFLASDASSLMTGAVVAVDGGYTCW